MITRRSLLAALLVSWWGCAPFAAGQETVPEGLEVVSIEARPDRIELSHALDYRQLVITGRLATGESVDLTRIVGPAESSPVVSISDDGLVRPAADGESTLRFVYGASAVEVPVRVTGAGATRPISFVRDVQPALSRMSCNSGTCHGSKDGKNGFKLSLRGYDPLHDHRALTDDIASRRFNRAAPDQSLMLLKATGSIPHVGGGRTQVGDRYYDIVRQWIADGARLDLDAPRVTSIEVFPQNPILPRAGLKQQIAVTATYADGSVRDVTREAFIESGNIEVVAADESGRLTMLRRGEAPVLVRYEGAYAATTLIVMGDRSGFVWSDPPTNNYIDQHVYAKLKRVKIQPSDLCTDMEFLRRATLDLTGMPPTVEDLHAFLNDPRPSAIKRDELIDQLVGSPAFIEHWTNKWADLLQVNRKFLGEEGAMSLRNWIKNAVATNMPYDRFAYEILTARGSNLDNPPASYYKILREPADLMENSTHLFLAVRFNCNKCHDHPFERWTQDQYYNLAAYFAQIGIKPDPAFAGKNIGGSAVEGAKPLVEVIFDKSSGEVTHERTGQVAPPAFPYGGDDASAASGSRREQLAEWMTSADNRYFARSYVNRLWGYMFGVGIIEPIDDIRAGNPPTNPELLDALTEDFVHSGFDMQHMVRTICKSRTYQHSVTTHRWNEDDNLNFSHAAARRLLAEVLFDSIHAVTGSEFAIPGVPRGFRAAELPDVGVDVPFLDDFGRPVRESSCECERSAGMVLGPVMKLVNGPTVASAILDPNNMLARMEKQIPDDRQLVEAVFLRFLSRYPTEAQIELGMAALADGGSELVAIRARLEQYESELAARQAEWEKQIQPNPGWEPVELGELRSAAGATLTREGDVVVAGGQTGKDTYTIEGRVRKGRVTGIRLEALPHESLPAGGPGRAKNGNFVLNELKVYVASESDPANRTQLEFRRATADFSQQGWDIAGAVDGDPATGWAVMPAFNQRHIAVVEVKTPVDIDGPALITVEMLQQYPDGMHLLGRFRLSTTDAETALGTSSLPEAISQILGAEAGSRTDEQRQQLAEFYRAQDTELVRLKTDVERSAEALKNPRLAGLQDLAWALMNTPAFLFNY